MKRVISIILCVSMLLSVGVIAAFANEKQPERYEARFVETFGIVYHEWYYYHELGDYYSVLTDRSDPDAEPDWVLVSANTDFAVPWSTYCVVGDRVLLGDGQHPFEHQYAVYDVRRDSFRTEDGSSCSIENVWDSGAFPELHETVERSGLGYPIGDADEDHYLTILDATRIQRILADLDQPASEDALERFFLSGYEVSFISDSDLDGERTIMDATRVQRKLAGLDQKSEYIRALRQELSNRLFEGKQVSFELLEQRDYIAADDNAKRNSGEFNGAVIQNAGDLSDFLGQSIETYNDAFFADNALFVARVRLSKGYKESFKMLDLTLGGEYLYPHFSSTGCDGLHYYSDFSNMDDRLYIYRIDPATAQSVKAMIASAEPANAYPIYSVDIENQPIRLPREKKDLKLLEHGNYGGEFVSQRSKTNRFNFAVLSSPADVYDLMGKHIEKYDEAFFADKKLLAAIYQDSADGSTFTVRDVYGKIDESWSDVYHYGVTPLTFRVDIHAPLPDAPVWKYMFYEYTAEDAEAFRNVKVVDTAAGTSENINAEFDDYFNPYYDMYGVTVLTRENAEAQNQSFYMSDDASPYITLFTDYQQYLSSPVAAEPDAKYDEAFFEKNSLLFVSKTYTTKNTLTASDVQAGADIAGAVTTPRKVADIYMKVNAVKDDDPAKNQTVDYNFWVAVPKLPEGKYYKSVTIAEPPFKK